jgi:hypothetical protein
MDPEEERYLAGNRFLLFVYNWMNEVLTVVPSGIQCNIIH